MYVCLLLKRFPDIHVCIVMFTSSNQGLRHTDSMSTISVYSSVGAAKGDYEISGEVLVGLEYRQEQLMVHVNRARGLAAADKNGLSDLSVVHQ